MLRMLSRLGSRVVRSYADGIVHVDVAIAAYTEPRTRPTDDRAGGAVAI